MVASVPLVYFDMNVWVEIARGVASQDPQVLRIERKARDLAGSSALFLLDGSNYLELWHRRDKESRENVGRAMRDLTQYVTFAPVQAIRSMEVEAWVQRHIGTYETVKPADLVGHGVCHAFGSPFGRFRFVESLASADGATPEGRAAAAPDGWMDLDRQGPKWEWLNLVGDQKILLAEGVDRTPQHRIGNSYVEGELQLRSLLQKESWARQRLRDLIVTDEIEALREDISTACWKAGVQPRSLFLENPAFETPPAAMRAFVDGLPSVDALATLREWKHRDMMHEWHQHDHSDLISLAVVIPYADVVVTERRWSHLARASGLSAKYRTQVYALRDLERALDDLNGGS